MTSRVCMTSSAVVECVLGPLSVGVGGGCSAGVDTGVSDTCADRRSASVAAGALTDIPYIDSDSSSECDSVVENHPRDTSPEVEVCPVEYSSASSADQQQEQEEGDPSMLTASSSLPGHGDISTAQRRPLKSALKKLTTGGGGGVGGRRLQVVINESRNTYLEAETPPQLVSVRSFDLTFPELLTFQPPRAFDDAVTLSPPDAYKDCGDPVGDLTGDPVGPETCVDRLSDDLEALEISTELEQIPETTAPLADTEETSLSCSETSSVPCDPQTVTTPVADKGPRTVDGGDATRRNLPDVVADGACADDDACVLTIANVKQHDQAIEQREAARGGILKGGRLWGGKQPRTEPITENTQSSEGDTVTSLSQCRRSVRFSCAADEEQSAPATSAQPESDGESSVSSMDTVIAASQQQQQQPAAVAVVDAADPFWRVEKLAPPAADGSSECSSDKSSSGTESVSSDSTLTETRIRRLENADLAHTAGYISSNTEVRRAIQRQAQQRRDDGVRAEARRRSGVIADSRPHTPPTSVTAAAPTDDATRHQPARCLFPHTDVHVPPDVREWKINGRLWEEEEAGRQSPAGGHQEQPSTPVAVGCGSMPEARRQFLSTLAESGSTAMHFLRERLQRRHPAASGTSSAGDRHSVASSSAGSSSDSYSLDDIDDALKCDESSDNSTSPSCPGSSGSSSGYASNDNQPSTVPPAVAPPITDELAEFADGQAERTRRLRVRYGQPGGEAEDDGGFSRRPSVRGIRPRFGSTREILQQMQGGMRRGGSAIQLNSCWPPAGQLPECTPAAALPGRPSHVRYNHPVYGSPPVTRRQFPPPAAHLPPSPRRLPPGGHQLPDGYVYPEYVPPKHPGPPLPPRHGQVRATRCMSQLDVSAVYGTCVPVPDQLRYQSTPSLQQYPPQPPPRGSPSLQGRPMSVSSAAGWSPHCSRTLPRHSHTLQHAASRQRPLDPYTHDV